VERARVGGFLILAALIGSVTWIIDASWGWHPEGWMVQIMGPQVVAKPSTKSEPKTMRTMPGVGVLAGSSTSRWTTDRQASGSASS